MAYNSQKEKHMQEQIYWRTPDLLEATNGELICGDKRRFFFPFPLTRAR
jgi:hypothetical protein